MAAPSQHDRRVVVVDGCRTPFCRSGTAFTDLTAYDLGRHAVAGLLHRTRIDPAAVDLLVLGTVVQDPQTSNLGREVAIGAGLPVSCPAYTVTVACVSSIQSFLSCVQAIQTGQAGIAIAAGAETLSDAPIRYKRPVRKRLIAAQKAKSPGDYAKLLKGLSPSDLLPDPPAIAEFTTGEVMGENCERLAKRLGITREAQDEYALASHLRAAHATEEGLLARQIAPIWVPPTFEAVRADNGIRGDSTPERLQKLKPVFDRKFGTVTAASSSFLSDGAAAVLVMTEERARELGFEPLAVVRSVSTAALDPQEELLLGPALTMPRAVREAGLRRSQIEVFELHEAFAGQVLSVLSVLEDASFCRERLGTRGAWGAIDRGKLNAWGGSLSVGHPFGATGARLIANCCERMAHEKARYGLVAACAAGAVGMAVALERP